MIDSRPMGEHSHAPDGRATRPMGEPATSLQQGLHTCPTGEPRPDGAASMCSRALQLEHVCRSYERPHKPGGLMRGGVTVLTPSRVGSRGYFPGGTFPEAWERVGWIVLDVWSRDVRAIVEAHGLVDPPGDGRGVRHSARRLRRRPVCGNLPPLPPPAHLVRAGKGARLRAPPRRARPPRARHPRRVRVCGDL